MDNDQLMECFTEDLLNSNLKEIQRIYEKFPSHVQTFLKSSDRLADICDLFTPAAIVNILPGLEAALLPKDFAWILTYVMVLVLRSFKNKLAEREGNNSNTEKIPCFKNMLNDVLASTEPPAFAKEYLLAVEYLWRQGADIHCSSLRFSDEGLVCVSTLSSADDALACTVLQRIIGPDCAYSIDYWDDYFHIESSFDLACKDKKHDLLKLLVSRGFPAPLHRAAENFRNNEVLKEVIKQSTLNPDGSPEANELYGETPLHRAVSHNNLQAAQALLECGADVNSVNREGDTPMLWILCDGWVSWDDSLAMLLIESGAKAVAEGGEPTGWSLFHHIALHTIPETSKGRATGEVRILMEPRINRKPLLKRLMKKPGFTLHPDSDWKPQRLLHCKEHKDGDWPCLTFKPGYAEFVKVYYRSGLHPDFLVPAFLCLKARKVK